MSVATAAGLLANIATAGDFWGNASHVGPTYALDPWDLVILGGVKLPGLCEVRGAAQLELDKKKTKGTNYVALTVTGYQPGPFEISCSIWTRDQWDAFRAWLDKFWIQPRRARITAATTKAAKAPMVAITVSHPALAAVGIYSCVIQGVSIPEAGSAEGVKIVKIKVVEHVQPTTKSATKTANGTEPTVDPEVRKEKQGVPKDPSTDRGDLGPKGPRDNPAGGSN